MNSNSAMQVALGQAAFDRGYNDRTKDAAAENPYHLPSQGFLHSRWAAGFKCADDQLRFEALQRGELA